jgi:S-adenosyl-L-methionine hydrolase (adenosine-forming)
MPRRTIALLTDFGIHSPYVGIMKGVIWTQCPEANIVDISHEVPPYGVADAAFLLETTWRYMPPRTIHVVVVDPGVGGPRKPILAIGDRGVYLAPDNGVLSYVLQSDSCTMVFELTEEHFWLKPVSATFHGRDIFAPAAAWLASGIDAERMGEPLEKPVTIPIARPRAEGSSLLGQVLHVDRFGNLVTNITRSVLENVLEKYGLKGFLASIGTTACERHIEYYGQVEPGVLASVFGSSGYLEVVAREASAAQMLGAGVGTQVLVRFHK